MQRKQAYPAVDMKSAEKLAYFFDASDLRSVFADWPSEIGLVLCMDD